MYRTKRICPSQRSRGEMDADEIDKQIGHERYELGEVGKGGVHCYGCGGIGELSKGTCKVNKDGKQW